jgi:chromosome segregation ATPase
MPICSKCGTYSVRLPCPNCSDKTAEEEVLVTSVKEPSKKVPPSTGRLRRRGSILAADEVERLQRLTESQQTIINDLETKLEASAYGQLESQVGELQNQIAEKDDEIARLASQVTHQEKGIQNYEKKLAQKDETITELEGLRSKYETLKIETATVKSKVADKIKLQTELEQTISDLQFKIKEQERLIQKQNQKLAESTKPIEDLSQ